MLAQAREPDLLSDEHFTVDGTLIEAWAGQKSFKRKGAEPQSRQTIPATPALTAGVSAGPTPPMPRPLIPRRGCTKRRQGQEAKLAYLGHVLMGNRHGLVVDTRVTQATGTAEREAALAMAEAIPGQQRVTLGADKNYDTHDFVRELRELRVTPHVAQNTTGRSSAIDGRTTRHPGYTVSQRKRKCVEEILAG